MTNFRDLLKQVKRQVGETSAEEVFARLEGPGKPSLLDVREDDEVANGIVPGARHLSRAHFESRVEDVLPDKGAEVVVYCQSGRRSAARSIFATPDPARGGRSRADQDPRREDPDDRRGGPGLAGAPVPCGGGSGDHRSR